PAKTAVWNRFRTQELETPQKRIALGNLKFLAQDRDLNEFFIRPKGFRHDTVQFPRASIAGRNSVVSGLPANVHNRNSARLLVIPIKRSPLIWRLTQFPLWRVPMCKVQVPHRGIAVLETRLWRRI